jgi:hypothetical protein
LKTIQNFFEIYRPLMNTWKLFENDEPGRHLVAVEKSGRLAVRDAKQFARIQQEAELEL